MEVLEMTIKQYEAQFRKEHKVFPEIEVGRFDFYSFKAKDDEEAVFLALKFAAKQKENREYITYNLAGVREARNVPLKYEYFNSNPDNIEKRIEEAEFQQI